jgi:hypothetical protein
VGEQNLPVSDRRYSMTYPETADHRAAEQEAGRQILSRATEAKERGEGFLELRIRSGYAGRWLSAVEALGWRLEHVGYVFTFTGWTSGAGEVNHLDGRETIGIYLFRTVNSSGGARPHA